MNDLDLVLKALNEKLHMQETLLDVQQKQIDQLKEKLRKYELMELEKIAKEAM